MPRVISSIITLLAMLSVGSSVYANDLKQMLVPQYDGISNPLIESPTWETLRSAIVGDVELLDGEQLMMFDVPITAADAATVPLTLSQRKGSGKRIKELTIVIDDNPMPVVASFEFGEMMGDIHLETRVRYDVYSNIRAIAKTESGETYMVGRFVQAAGGCSSSAVRDIDDSLAIAGQMKMKHFLDNLASDSAASSKLQLEAQLMIRHPNFTGMQVDARSMEYIGARYINKLEVVLAEDLLFRMTGGFSISEDPSFRFKFTDNGATEFTVHVTDTSQAEFTKKFPIKAGV